MPTQQHRRAPLKSLQAEIEKLQAEYREIRARNMGVIRGAEQTHEITKRIEELMCEYISRRLAGAIEGEKTS